MPFVISYPTVFRAVEKLIKIGLVVRRENVLFAVVQNEPCLVQNEPGLVQNEPDLVQNEPKSTPPYNPPIINNINNKIKASMQTNFEIFWNLFSPSAEYSNRRAATQMIFEKRSSAAQQAILSALRENGHGSAENPFFYVQDFPDPQPTFLRGDEPGDLVQVRYNGLFKICTRATMELFGLEYIRDWH